MMFLTPIFPSVACCAAHTQSRLAKLDGPSPTCSKAPRAFVSSSTLEVFAAILHEEGNFVKHQQHATFNPRP